MTQRNLFMEQKQTQRHSKQNYGYQREKQGERRDELGVWDQQIQTAIFKIDKQGPTVQHRKLYLIINYNGKESEKEYTCTHTYMHI